MSERELSSSQNIAQLIEAWAQLEEAPRALVHKDLKLIWKNAAAAERLRQEHTIRQEQGYITCFTNEATEALKIFLNSCSAAPGTFCLGEPSSPEHMLFKAWRIQPVGEDAVFGFLFYTAGDALCREYADFGQAFRLTATQNKVVRLLLDGHTAEQVAQLLKISLETVRSHIRAIYVKLDVGSREALFSRLQTYRL